MEQAKAYDASGNLMVLHELITIAPVALVDACRVASLEFLQQFTAAGVSDASGLLNVPVYSPGEPDPSHFACVRKAYCDEVALIEAFIAARNPEEYARRRWTLADAPELIRSRIGIFCGEFSALLAHLGLEVR